MPRFLLLLQANAICRSKFCPFAEILSCIHLRQLLRASARSGSLSHITNSHKNVCSCLIHSKLLANDRIYLALRDAESEWAGILQEVAAKYSVRIDPGEVFNEETRYLWGKNFLPNSEIRYEYYADGVHSSYPDFVMKDRKGRVHLFEVKSVNHTSGSNIDPAEYKEKVRQLKACYLACSKKLDGYIFYLPLLKDDTWQITRFCNGTEDTLSEDSFRESLE